MSSASWLRDWLALVGHMRRAGPDTVRVAQWLRLGSCDSADRTISLIAVVVAVPAAARAVKDDDVRNAMLGQSLMRDLLLGQPQLSPGDCLGAVAVRLPDGSPETLCDITVRQALIESLLEYPLNGRPGRVIDPSDSVPGFSQDTTQSWAGLGQGLSTHQVSQQTTGGKRDSLNVSRDSLDQNGAVSLRDEVCGTGDLDGQRLVWAEAKSSSVQEDADGVSCLSPEERRECALQRWDPTASQLDPVQGVSSLLIRPGRGPAARYHG